MENHLLIPAALVLALTTISFAVQARYWRKQARASEHAAMGMAAQLARVGRESHDAGWQSGKRHAIGLMYKIASKANHEGRDILTALHEVAQPDAEPIVQVLAEV